MKLFIGITRTVVTDNGTYQLQNSDEIWEIDSSNPTHYISSVWMTDDDGTDLLRLPIMTALTIQGYIDH